MTASPLGDDKLLDFDTGCLADYEDARTRAALDTTPDLFRSHLFIAKWIDRWIEGMQSGAPSNDAVQEGFEIALREVAAHLRQGDFLPGGTLYEDAAERR